MWLGKLEVRDLRRIREASFEMEPGLNVFVGRNAQGKTSLLEAVGLLARGRSFRTEDTRALIRHGAAGLMARGCAHQDGRSSELEIELSAQARRLRVDGRLGQFALLVTVVQDVRPIRRANGCRR